MRLLPKLHLDEGMSKLSLDLETGLQGFHSEPRQCRLEYVVAESKFMTGFHITAR